MPATGIILLAAGDSARMGRPKQLLLYEGKTLLRRAAETALASPFRPVVVVLGEDSERFLPELAGEEARQLRVIVNPEWRAGMGSSIRAGVRALLDGELGDSQPEAEAESGGTRTRSAIEAAVIMLCDQPLLTAETLIALEERHRRSGNPVVASKYGGVLGVPALFHHSLFPELLALNGSEGAKKIIQRYSRQAGSVSFPGGRVDVDTPEDYDALHHA